MHPTTTNSGSGWASRTCASEVDGRAELTLAMDYATTRNEHDLYAANWIESGQAVYSSASNSVIRLPAVRRGGLERRVVPAPLLGSREMCDFRDPRT